MENRSQTARRATAALTTLALAALAAASMGCSSSAPARGRARIAVRGEHAVVVVQGLGKVTGPGPIACAPGAVAELCRGSWNELSGSSLTATPAPGWSFDHWEWRSTNAAISPGFQTEGGATVTYTAVFVPATGQARHTAKR